MASRLPTVNNYLKNVTKSVAFSARDVVLRDLMPDVGDMIDANKDFVKSTVASIRAPKAKDKRFVEAFGVGKIFSSVDYGFKNIIQDLKSGDLYNSAREDQDLLEISGFDFGDLDDLSEFGIDSDWEDQLNGKSSKTGINNSVTKGELEIVKSVERTSAAQAQATVNAVISSNDYVAKTSRINTGVLFQQQEKLFGGMHKDLSVIGATLTSIFKLQSNVLTNMDQNISKYQTESLKLENERNAILKEMLEMQRNQYKTAQQKELESASKRSSKRKRFSDISIGGSVDLNAYFENVVENIKNEIGLGGDGMDIADMIKMMMVNPMREVTKMGINYIIPTIAKQTMKDVNDTFSSIFANLISKANSKSGDWGWMGTIGRIFGLRDGVDRKINTGSYEKGQVPWDGISRRALINVIPGYLRRIEARLSGDKEIDYNYETGKWIHLSSQSAEYRKIKQNAYRNATSDLMQSGLNRKLNAITPTSSKDKEEFDLAIDEFREYLYDVNGNFYPHQTRSYNKVSASAYPHFYKYYSKIAKAYDEYDIVNEVKNDGRVVGRHTKTGVKMQIAGNAMRGKTSEDAVYRSYEANGTSNMIRANEYGDKIKADDVNKNGLGIGGGLLKLKDEYGFSVYNYLHNINQELLFWRTNYGTTGFVNTSNGTPPVGTSRIINYDNLTLESKEVTKQREDRVHRSQAKKNNSQASASDYKRATFEDIMSGRMEDLRDFSNYESREYAFELSRMSKNERKAKYREVTGRNDYNEKIFDEFYQKQFYKAGINSMERLDLAINKANSNSNLHTYDSLSSQEKSFFRRIVDKIGGGKNFIDSLVHAPGQAFSSILYAADRSVYDMFFKAQLKDDGTEYNGFMEFLAGKTKSILNTLKKSITEKLTDFFENNPLGQKLAGYGKRFKNTFGKSVKTAGDYAVKSMGELPYDVAMMAGGKVKGYAIMGKQNSYFKNNVGRRINKNDVVTKVVDKEAAKQYRDSLYKAVKIGGDALHTHVANKDFTGNIDEKTKILIGYGVSENRIKRALKYYDEAKEKALADIESDENLSEQDKTKARDKVNAEYEKVAGGILDKMFARRDVATHAKGTISKPFKGRTMLSQGELLFNDKGVTMVNKTGAYDINTPTDIMTSGDSYELLNALGINAGQKKKSIQRDQALENIERNKMKSHAAGTFGSKLFNRSMNGDELTKIIGEAKGLIPEMAAGGVLGGGASLLLGLTGGPILGAAVGAATLLTKNSKTVQSILFGKAGENGEREDNGIIKKSVQDAVKKYAPDMGKFGLAGVIGSFLTPLGPVGGLMIGSAIGFLKNNEEMRNKIFGRLKIGEDEKDIIKKMLPGALKGAGVGAVATLFGGPFGLMGNALIGSAIGMVTSTDEFKDSILGDMVDGVRQGGLLGMVKDAFEPLTKAAIDFKDRILTAVDKNIIQPMADFIQPAIHAIPQVMAWIPRKINDMMNEKFGWGFDTVVQKLLIAPVKLLAKPFEKIAGGIFNAVTYPFKLVGVAGNMIRGVQMNTNNADYMTAEERIKWKKEHNKGDDIKGDEFFAGLGASKAKEMLNSVTAIDDNISTLDRARKKKNIEIRRVFNEYKTADGLKISAKAKEEIGRLINSGDPDAIKKIPQILQTYKLEGSDVGMTDAQIKAFMSGYSGVGAMISDFMNIADRQTRVRTMTADDKENDLKKLQEDLKAAGLNFDLTKKTDRQKLERYLNTEYKYKSSLSFSAQDEVFRSQIAEETGKNVKDITDILKNIQENGLKLRIGNNAKTAQNEANVQQALESGINKTTEDADKIEAFNRATIGSMADGLKGPAADALRAGKFDKTGVFERSDYVDALTRGEMTAEDANEAKAAEHGGYSNKINWVRKFASIKASTSILNKRDIILGLDKGAPEYIVGLSDRDCKSAYSVLKNKWVAMCIAQAGRKINAQDIKDAIKQYTRIRAFINTCRFVAQNNLGRDYSTLSQISASTGAALVHKVKIPVNNQSSRYYAGSTQEAGVIAPVFEGSEPPQQGHFLGTLLGLGGSLIGGLVKGIGSMFGGGNKDQQQQGPDANTGGGLLSSITSAGGGLLNGAKNIIGGGLHNTDETDVPGDGRDVAAIGDGFGLIKRKSDGSVEPDTSDSHTKDLVNKMTMKEKLTEKLQAAQTKASDAIAKAFEVGNKVKTGAKKGMGWLSALLLGGLLLKSGILQKIFNGVIKPIWTEHIYPWITDTAAPWLKEHVLTPLWDGAKSLLSKAGTWLLETGLPKLGGVITDLLPDLASAIGSAFWTGAKSLGGSTIKNLPGIALTGVKSILGFGDAATGNKTNVGTKNKISYKEKDPDAESGIVNSKGEYVTWGQIANGDYDELYNPEGARGVVDPETGMITFEDESARGSGYAQTVANGMVHAVTQNKVGVGAKAVNLVSKVGNGIGNFTKGIGKGSKISKFITKLPVVHGLTNITKLGGALTKGATNLVMKPIQAATAVTNGVNKTVWNSIKNVAENEGYTSVLKTATKNLDDIAAKTATNSAKKVVSEAAEAGTKKAGLISRLVGLAKKGLTKVFNSNTLLTKIADIATSLAKKPSELVEGLFKHITGLVDDIVGKACAKLGVEATAQIASKATVILAIVQAVADFATGCDQAESILGVTDPDAIETIVAGLTNMLCNLIIVPAIWPGVPTVAQKIYEFFGDKLKDRQEEAEQEYQNYLDETGSTLTKEEYLKRKYSFTGKVGGAISDAVKATKNFIGKGVSFLGNGLKTIGKGILDLPGNIWGGITDAASWIGDKAKSAGSAILDGAGKAWDTVVEGSKAATSWVADTAGGLVDWAGEKLNGVGNFVGGLLGLSGEEENIIEVGKTIGSNIANGIGNIGSSALDVIGSGLNNVKDFFKNTISGITKIKEENDEVIEAANSGNVSVFSSEYWSMNMGDSSSLGGILGNISKTLSRVVNAPFVIVKSIANNLLTSIKNIGNWVSDQFGGVADFFNDPLDYIYKKITGQETSDSTVESGYMNQDGVVLSSGQSGSSSIQQASTVSGQNAVSKPATKSSSSHTASYSPSGTSNGGSNNNSTESGGFFSSAWKKIKSLFGKGTAGPVGGYSKQNDPSIANIRYNKSNDTEYQTIGDSGCGPAAAVNLMESIYGRGSQEIVKASQFALNRGYKETDGGTRPEFFTDYFANNGFGSSISYSKKQIADRINSGAPTVLMGKDSRGTSNTTPFGRTPHYVTVTGLDQNGNAIVQDPESRYDNQIYRVKDLMRKTQLGVSAMGTLGRGKFGRGIFGRGKSKMIMVGDSKTVGMHDAVYGGNASQYTGTTDGDGNVWICKVGAGISWMKNQLGTIDSKVSGDYAVVICMGVNDVPDGDGTIMAPSYISWINDNGKKWIQKGADVYFVSIPPITGISNDGGYVTTNERIQNFNAKVSSGLDSTIKYLNIYDSLVGKVTCTSDNLHYTSDTYKLVFQTIKSGVTSGATSEASTSGDSTSGSSSGDSGSTGSSTTVDGRNMLLFYAKYKKNEGNNSFSLSSETTTSDTSSTTTSTDTSSSTTTSDSSTTSTSTEPSTSGGTNSSHNSTSSGTRRVGGQSNNVSQSNNNSGGVTGTIRRVVNGATNFVNNLLGRNNTDSAKSSPSQKSKSTKKTTSGGNVLVGVGKNYKSGRYGKGEELSSVGQFFSNVIANSAAAQVLNSFLDMGSSSSSTTEDSTTTTTTTSDSTTSTGGTQSVVGGKYQGKKYNLNDTQVNQLANAFECEQGGNEGIASEASLAANILETDSTYASQYGSDIVKFMQNAGWFAAVTRSAAHNTSPSEYSAIVKDVIVNGNRTLPQFVNEHDCFSDLTSVTKNGQSMSISSKDSYVRDVTKVHNKYGANWTFWDWASPSSKSGDPFGYTSDSARKASGIPMSGSGGNGVKPRSGMGVLKSRSSRIPQKGNEKFGKGKYGRGATDSTTAQQIWAYFTNKGFSPAAIGGILGNMEHESGVFPQRVQDDFSSGYSESIAYTQQVDSGAVSKDSFVNGGPGGGGYGLVQFTYSPYKKELYENAKNNNKSIGDLGLQLDTFSSQAADVLNKIKNSTDPKSAASIMLREYERPADIPGTEPARQTDAVGYYNLYNGKTFTWTGESNSVSGGEESSSESVSTGSTSNGSDGMSSIGQWLSNVIANSPAAQVLNSFLDMGGSSGGTTQTASNGSSGSSSGGVNASGDPAAVVAVAKKEADLTDGTNKENPMGSNNVKYNDWYYGRNVSGSEYPWCAAFVSWVTNQAGVPTSVFPKDAYTVTAYQSVGSSGGSYPKNTEAAPGDIIYYTNNGAASGIYHTGIVESASNGTINTIEGNSSDMVSRRSPSMSSTSVLLARPKYANASYSGTPSTESTTTTTSSSDDAPDVASTLGSNGIKPISKFGQFKEAMYGKGSTPGVERLASKKVRIRDAGSGQYYTVEKSGYDAKLGEAMKRHGRKAVYGKGGNSEVNNQVNFYGRGTANYDEFLRQIVQILLKVASNTDKLNNIVTILQEKLNIEVTTKDVSDAATRNGSSQEELAAIIAGSNAVNNRFSSYADSVEDSSMNSIIRAMNTIATE